MGPERRVRFLLRVGGWLLAGAWFAFDEVEAHIPYWVPFFVLLAVEVEFVLRGLVEARRGVASSPDLASRRAPGEDDADLGWGTLVEDVDETGASVARWVPPPVRAPRRSPLVLPVAGAIVAAGLFLLAYRADRSESWGSLTALDRATAVARFRAEAGIVAGRPVDVRCDERYALTGAGSDALGVAFVDRGLAYLVPAVCRRLHGILDSTPPRRSDEAGEAILVLAHEAIHLRGERREGVTECIALQEGVGLAQRLGFSRPDALALMRGRYEASLAERSITRITYRLPEECRDGGSLDVRTADARFP